ncbi:MAG: ADP-ribosylglycohydrolase family protein [Scytonematopsis contorta HA4267-MV1]|jgi:ADP-ribosylglycohydrolase|nr:ADP-ribosylglycohydrolase family protein [Scytonematopsis contorta HA4267-MV1]
MRYSLASRFRGTFIGAYLGECFAFDKEKSPSGSTPGLFNIDIHSFSSNCDTNHIDDWGKITVLNAQSLITLGKFDLDAWEKNLQIIQTPSEGISEGSCQYNLQAILTAIPVALFFHENSIKLRQNLLYVVKILGDEPILQDGVLAVGYAIALALTEKLHPQTLIPQIISFMGENPTPLSENLLKVNELLSENAGLERVRGSFDYQTKSTQTKPADLIAIAFYCFLATLEDFRLGVLRSTQLGLYGQQIAPITGALSGAYNSMVSIPVTWQFQPEYKKTLFKWGFTNFSQMLELSDALVVAWSGVYSQSSDITAAGLEVPTVAAPRVIR